MDTHIAILCLYFRRKNYFSLCVALDLTGLANGELYWDDGEELGEWRLFNPNPAKPGPEVIKLFFMLNSAEHEQLS